MTLNRREFCVGGLLTRASTIRLHAAGLGLFPPTSGPRDLEGLHITLENVLDHPFHARPETLLSYPIAASFQAAFQGRALIDTESGNPVPFQVVETDGKYAICFMSGLPPGKTKRFNLVSGENVSLSRGVHERLGGNGIVLDSGKIQVKIPASQSIRGVTPGPIQQIDDGPNYRWDVAVEGGCGMVYFFANGKAYRNQQASPRTDSCKS